MKKKDFDELLKRFDGWKNQLRDELKPFKNNDDVIPPEALARIVKLGLDLDPMKQFLSLGPPVAAMDAPVLAAKPAEAKPAPAAASFDEFMSSLARSMVTTQQSLDQASAAYLTSIEGRPHIQASVFRLPKLEAQMKFGLEIGQKTKLNLLFWGKDKETSELNQQGINFEIVSVPAAPGAIESARQSQVRWTLVLDPLKRDSLLDLVIAQPPNDQLKPVIEAAGDTPDAVAFLDLGDGRRSLVLYANDKQEKNVGIWLLTRDGDQAVLEVLYRFARSLGPEEHKMGKLVMELAAQQSKLAGG
jgi:hypothetical protein